MKKIVTLIAVFAFFSAQTLLAQNWEFSHVLYDFQLPQNDAWGVHGVVVAPDGNIWVALHGNLAQDTVITGTDTVVTRPLYVLDPSGNHVSFSPIRWLDIPGAGRDTLDAAHPTNGSGKGISIDNDGNILFTSFSTLYRINYQTGEGMNRFIPTAPIASMTEGVQDVNGNIYIGYVGGGNPLYILDNNFNLVGNAIDAVPHLQRSIAVSEDGTDLYIGSIWTAFGIEKWHSDLPGLAPFVPVDTLGNWTNLTVQDTSGNDTTLATFAIWASSLDWDPDGNLWAGMLKSEYSGTLGNKGSRYYAIDVATGARIDSVGIPLGDSTAGGLWSPRGATWSNDGMVMYLADYDYNNVTAWNKVTAIGEQNQPIRTFNLHQSYPNPFNPVATIPFAIGVAGDVELTVYNVRGQLVKTLLKKRMTPGNYKVEFDASDLPSGNYFYRMKSNGRTMTHKMVLVK